MRTLKILTATALTLASFSSYAAMTPGTGIAGTRHDWSSAVNAAGTSGGQALLQYYVSDPATFTPPASNPAQTLPNVSNYVTPWKVMTGPPDAQGNPTQATVRVQIGLCTKCHTPHQAKSTNLLWNHTLSINTFKWDQPYTTAGTKYAEFKGDTYKGPTTKCLSCHDGSLSSTDGMWFNRANTAGSKYVAPAGSLDSGHEVSSQTGDMSGSHPVAMPYPLNGQPNLYNQVVTGKIEPGEWIADPSTIGIRLFNDVGGNIIAGALGGQTGIECTSCHDVHNGARTKDIILLTGKINGSAEGADGYICNKCHNK